MKAFSAVSSDYELIVVPLSLGPAFHLSPCWVPLTIISVKPQDPRSVAGGGEEGPKLARSAWVLNHVLVSHWFFEVSPFWKLHLNIVVANIVWRQPTSSVPRGIVKKKYVFFFTATGTQTSARKGSGASAASTGSYTSSGGWMGIARNPRDWKEKSTGFLPEWHPTSDGAFASFISTAVNGQRSLQDTLEVPTPSAGTPCLCWWKAAHIQNWGGKQSTDAFKVIV